jgi:hypothetical protein
VEQALGEVDLVKRLAVVVIGVADARLAGQLGHDRAQSVARGEHAERGGHRGLADPTLAGDEDEAAIEQSRHDRGTYCAPGPARR